MSKGRKIITMLMVGVALAALVASGCTWTEAPRGPSASLAKYVFSPEDQWSEPVNLWNLNTERANKRAYLSLDGNTLILGRARGGRAGAREGYLRVAKWTGTGTGWSDPIEEERKAVVN